MENYEVHISNFDGPLDLLLHLIHEKQMDLLNLEISKITEQYLSYIRASQALHLEVASEYLTMAAYLVEMKSKLLLPKEVVEVEDSYQEDPREALIKRLLEYKKFKEVVDKLQLKKEERLEIYEKMPMNLNALHEEDLSRLPDDLDPYALILAMQKLMKRKVRMNTMSKAVAKKEISIEDRTEDIRRILSIHRGKKIPFETLFDEGDKQLFVVTFLAILVLANQKKLRIDQSAQFSEIYVEGLENGI